MNYFIPNDVLAEVSPAVRELLEYEQGLMFIRSRWFEEWKKRAEKEVSIGFFELVYLYFSSFHGEGKIKWAAYRFLKKVIGSDSTYRTLANQRVTGRVLKRYSKYFDEVESNPLTLRQREAVASDEDSNLVIAGAGTGKTSTIVAKIGFLLDSGQCLPQEILAISFTKKSADDLAKKVKETLDVVVDISTFHRLGLGIIAGTTGEKPRLAPFIESPDEKIKHVDRIISSLCSDNAFKRLLVNFTAYFRCQAKSSWDFKNLAEYRAWLSSNRIVSLDGVPKKSYQECLIANWLILQGVKFEYEKPYEHNTKTREFRQYCPDFYISELDVYIEHFGVDENDVPAPYIDAAKYQEGMEWKRRTHRINKTILIETYSWEQGKGVLLSGLRDKLIALGCKFKPIDIDDALRLLNEKGEFKGFSELVATFLTLYKGNGSRLINQLVDCSPGDFERNKIFLELFGYVFDEYERINFDNDQIDFEDMISRAAEIVKSGRFGSFYKYILVDEFQDISPGRAALVNSLLDTMPGSALFAVGDDWQSIYRFAGSDIGGMTKFGKIFGPCNQVPLDTTFRFDDYTAATSSRFILKNSSQIQKNIATVKVGDKPSVLLYKQSRDYSALYWCMDRIAKEARSNATVFILERYKFYLPTKDDLLALSHKYPSLVVSAMTVHASKGLEADYVIVGLQGGNWGFPATKSDDAVLNMVLTQSDAFPYGEERRLFYVALTRAKCRTFLVCESGVNFSVFAAELESEKTEYKIDIYGENGAAAKCARCNSGSMVLRDGLNGQFYGCSNFPLCDNMQSACPRCQKGMFVKNESGEWQCNKCSYKARSCPRCKTGLLQQRSGKNGPFVGCSNYREPEVNCRYTENGALH